MNEIPAGYKDIPEEDSKKAKVFFERAATVANAGQFDYAIEMYLSGLKFDPEAVDAHQALREISMRRKAGGGKPLGFMQKNAMKKGDELTNMLNAEKLLAYDPGNTGYMVELMSAAQKAGCYDTVLWVGPMAMRANLDEKKPDFNKFIQVKDIYVLIGRYQQAVEAIAQAMKLRPGDMELVGEMRHLSANESIKRGNYDSGGSFRDSVRNKEAQQKLIDADRDVRSLDSLEVAIQDAEAAYDASPADNAMFSKFVEALRRTEQPEHENRAIDLLEQKYAETRQYKWRQTVGNIQMAQLNRMDRSQRQGVAADPNNQELRRSYIQFVRDKTEQELNIWTEVSANYPTDQTARFEVARRLFMLNKFDDAIPVLQQVRSDPKYKAQATVFLGRAFLESGFVEEASDTLSEAIAEYPAKGDEKSREMTYWFARALEQKGDAPVAIKNYSQVFQWDAKYRDVAARIKNLRALVAGGNAPRTT